MMDEYFNRYLNQFPYFYIDKHHWKYIKETFDEEYVKDVLADICMTYPLPYISISKEDARINFRRLKGIRWNELLKEGEWSSRTASKYPITYNDNYFYFGRCNVGNSASNYFHQKNRWAVNCSAGPGPEKTWRTKKYMITMLSGAYSLKLEKIGRHELKKMLELRKYVCSQFKPSIAKIFYDMFNARNILDFSMGWGDRLAGFYASFNTEYYLGLDPRKENHPLYDEQVKLYSKLLGFFEKEKRTEFHECPAEDFDFSPYNNCFDLVFTSPPYFDAERYSYDDTQSWVRYKDIETWNEKFLYKTLENIYPTVKEGGRIAINISDVYYRPQKRWLEICNPMNDYLVSMGLTYEGCIGTEITKRLNSGVDKSAFELLCEPIWIFRKGPVEKLKIKVVNNLERIPSVDKKIYDNLIGN